jgi:GNAT acetyltransferase-like protein
MHPLDAPSGTFTVMPASISQGDGDMRPLDTVWTRTLSAGDGCAFDAFVERAGGGHFAQTRAWASVARAARPCRVEHFIARRDREIVGTALIVRPRVAGLITPLAIVERGPVVDQVTDLPCVLKALVRASRRRGIVRLRVMPYWAAANAEAATNALRRCGFRSTQTRAGAHAATLRLELAEGPTLAETLAGSEHSKLRYRLARARRLGAIVRFGTEADLPALATLHRAMLAAQGRRGPTESYFSALFSAVLADRRRGALLLCEHGGELISTVVVVRHSALATYLLGAGGGGRRPFGKSLPPLVRAIEWAQENGCRTFDLGGVPLEDDRDPKRTAIAEFKSGISKARTPLVHEHVRWF